MPDFKPTPSQETAMSVRNRTILVSAGAGSGKTRVLVERLLRSVTDPDAPCSIDDFLVITYTKAAAGELRARITKELAKAIAADPGNQRLRSQSARVAGAPIGTIHSFCAGILRDNCQLIGLPPDFRIIDDDRADVMKSAALDRLLEACYEDPEKIPGFLKLADAAVGSSRDDSGLKKLVLDLHAKMQCHARPDAWAEEQITAMKKDYADAGDTPWGKALLEDAGKTVDNLLRELEALKILVQDDAELAGVEDNLEKSIRALEGLKTGLGRGWDKAAACLPVEFPRWNWPRKNESPLKEPVKARRNRVKAAADKLKNKFPDPSEQMLQDLKKTAPVMETLLRLAMAFDAAYRAEKRKASSADYSDLEHYAAQILTHEDGTPTELARSLSGRYREIMVDEYQDVSRVQEAIFTALSRDGNNLFMVGDVKQSIYRFRLADPDIFREKYEKYLLKPERETDPQLVLLRENFRSRREILDCANAVFSACMSETVGEVEYDDKAALIAGASYEGLVPVPELTLLQPMLPEDEESSEDEIPDDDTAEARFAAAKIRQLMAEGTTVTDGDGQRPLRYGDIAILLHSANKRSPVYAAVFDEYGIPVAAGHGEDYFVSAEINAILAWLSIIDNPHRDIPLITAMCSPAAGFTPEELSFIRAVDKDTDLFGAVTRTAQGGEGVEESLGLKCGAFLALLKQLRDAAPDTEPAELIRQIYNLTDMPAVYGAMENGMHRRDNLMLMPQLAGRFAGTGQNGLHRFVLWLERMAEKRAAVSSAAQDDSAVHIMTIHKSKGLEFPVVFLCDTGKRFNLDDSKEAVLVHKELGLGPKVTDEVNLMSYPTLARLAIGEKIRNESLSEEMRLLYVAMTRPRERLYITASCKDACKKLNDLENEVSGNRVDVETLRGHGCHADWLILAAFADKCRHLKLRPAEPGDLKAEAVQEETAAEMPEKAEAEDLAEALDFTYPHHEAEDLPSKLTATELKGRGEADPDTACLPAAENAGSEILGSRHARKAMSFRQPDFTDGKTVSGAARGTAVHLVLQQIRFDRTGSGEQVKAEIERLRENLFLSDAEAASVPAEKIVEFYRSEIGRRILKADECRREFRFSLLCDAEELLGTAAGEKILLQGSIDCLIVEKGQITIIDYKTDYIADDKALAEKTAFYAGQLNTYAKAAAKIFGLPVKEKLLYYIGPGKTVPVE